MEDRKNRRPPVIAILTMPDQEKQFRGNRKNFIDIIRKGKQLKIPVYIVTTDHLLLHQPRILAYHYNPADDSWNQKWIPLPDVIYNRIPYREDEHRPEVRQLLQECLLHPRIHIYNPSFFNKWELFKWLRHSRSTKKYIPLTVRLSPHTKLLPLLKKYPFLYLKPVKGKAGLGIMRISRKKTEKYPYTLSIQENRGSQTMKFLSLPEMRRQIHALIGEDEYIVQQGIALARMGGRPFDLRVLLQKNGRGKWRVTGIGARMAGESSITTHIPRGGSMENPLRLLKTAFGTVKGRRIYSASKETALRLARRIERESKHLLGEMSMDLGVDQKANLWFFEANAKPMKFDEPKIRERSLRLFFDYCCYLKNTKKSGRR